MTATLIRSRTMTFGEMSGRAVKMALAGFAALALVACSSDPDQAPVRTTTAPTAPAPSGPTPGTQQDLVVNVGDRVFFDTDQSSLRADARATLQRQAAWMNQYPAVRVTLEGHADERGSREYNLALGESRALSIKQQLLILGASSSQIRLVSYGEERPAVDGHDEASWQQNRRVEILY